MSLKGKPMRKPILAGNWKMHNAIVEAQELVKGITVELTKFDHSAVDAVICPPYTALAVVSEATRSAGMGLGAQNMHWEPRGAFTGEISPLMLQGLCDYVILGHSERRQYFGESDDAVNKKIRAGFEHGLTPIVCVGENLDQNQAGETAAFVGKQVRGALEKISPQQVQKLIIAYEPIWAIGSGMAATAEGANEIISTAIRGVLADLYGPQVAERVRVQYGGSVKPANIAEFMEQPEIDGALVGGACLEAKSFAAIIRGAIQAKGL
jgi:triosephosphate isomerase